MNRFHIEKAVPIPKIEHDFMRRFRGRILKTFAQMKDGDSVVLQFHPSLIYPICNTYNLNIVTRQIAQCSWRFWVKPRSFDIGTDVTILSCAHNKVNKGNKGKIVSKMESGYTIEVTNDEGTHTVFVEPQEII